MFRIEHNANKWNRKRLKKWFQTPKYSLAEPKPDIDVMEKSCSVQCYHTIFSFTLVSNSGWFPEKYLRKICISKEWWQRMRNAFSNCKSQAYLNHLNWTCLTMQLLYKSNPIKCNTQHTTKKIQIIPWHNKLKKSLNVSVKGITVLINIV